MHTLDAYQSSIDQNPQCSTRQVNRTTCGQGQGQYSYPQQCFTVSMDRQTWVTLSEDGKAKWDTISIADHAKILQGT